MNIQLHQPPSGGCVLKPLGFICIGLVPVQPPSGGCVLKLELSDNAVKKKTQPPSGGCVLKLHEVFLNQVSHQPAAFRRLCVETKRV